MPPDTIAPPGLLSREHRALTIGIIALVSLIAFEYLAVATAMPTVAEKLNGIRLYALAFGGALAAGVISMVAAGRWCDARGPAGPMRYGVGLFIAGLLIAGSAPDMWFVVAGRMVQGFGSGLVSVAIYVIVARAYQPESRPRMFGALAAAWVVPSIVGPAITGLAVQYAGWRWVFLSVPALAVPAAALIWPALRQPDPTVHDGQSEPRARDGNRLGWAVLAAAAAATLHYGGQQRPPVAAVLLTLAVIGMAVSVPRLLPAGTLRFGRGLPTVVALRGLAGAAVVAAEVFIPLLLSRERGLSPAAAGLALTAGALTWSAGSWYQGRTPRWAANPTRLLRIGMGLIAVGIVIVTLVLIPAVPPLLALGGWAVTGFGMGLVYPILSVLTLGLSTVADQGANSSALQLSESLTITATLALTGTVFAALLTRSTTAAYLTAFSVACGLAVIGVLISRRAVIAPSPSI